jgi:hypothetical protein
VFVYAYVHKIMYHMYLSFFMCISIFATISIRVFILWVMRKGSSHMLLGWIRYKFPKFIDKRRTIGIYFFYEKEEAENI